MRYRTYLLARYRCKSHRCACRKGSLASVLQAASSMKFSTYRALRRPSPTRGTRDHGSSCARRRRRSVAAPSTALVAKAPAGTHADERARTLISVAARWSGACRLPRQQKATRDVSTALKPRRRLVMPRPRRGPRTKLRQTRLADRRARTTPRAVTALRSYVRVETRRTVVREMGRQLQVRLMRRHFRNRSSY